MEWSEEKPTGQVEINLVDVFFKPEPL